MAKEQSPGIDTSVPQSARIWDYWLGGKDDLPVDREVGEAMRRAVREVMDRGGTPVRARSPEEIERLFAGARLLEPGVVSCSRWRPDPSRRPEPEVPHFGGVAIVTGDE